MSLAATKRKMLSITWPKPDRSEKNNLMTNSAVGALSIPYPKAGIKLTTETYADLVKNAVQ